MLKLIRNKKIYRIELAKILKISIIFLLGFISANLVSFYFVYGLENPFLMGFGFSEISSSEAPFDFIQESQIQVYQDKIIININDASISRYAPTGSMKPVLDKGANGIRIKPNSEEDIHIGDIITFKKGSNFIVHRVIDKGTDNQGTYFITKGDNNSIDDGKIRFKNIEYITIGIIW